MFCQTSNPSKYLFACTTSTISLTNGDTLRNNLEEEFSKLSKLDLLLFFQQKCLTYCFGPYMLNNAIIDTSAKIYQAC